MNDRLCNIIDDLALALLAFIVATVSWLFVAAIAGLDPLQTIVLLVKGSVGSLFALEQTIRSATPLLLTGLAVAIPAQAGLLLIGTEGAFVIGGLSAAAMAVTVPESVSLITLIVAGAVGGGAWLGLVGVMKNKRKVHEAISSLLMTYIALAIVNQLIEGFLRDPESLDQPSTVVIPTAAQIGTIGWGSIHWGLIVGILACAISYVVINHSKIGLSARFLRSGTKLAIFAGIPSQKMVLGLCVISGVLAGLAGAIEIGAVQKSASISIAQGYGYVGILVAFIARGNMLMVIVASLLVGAIEASGGLLQRQLEAPATTAKMMESLLFISLVVCESLRGKVSLQLRKRIK